jgi:hypothetical protein
MLINNAECSIVEKALPVMRRLVVAEQAPQAAPSPKQLPWDEVD